MASEPAGDAQAFEADLASLGFRFMQDGRGGVRQYAARATPYLVFWVHWSPHERTVLFTWEHSIGEYLNSIDMQIGANEELNQFLFPKYDARGPQDLAFVAQEMDRVERVLRAVNLLEGI